MRWKILSMILALMLLFQPISAFGDKQSYTPQFGDKQSLGQDEIPGDKENSPYNRLLEDVGGIPDVEKPGLIFGLTEFQLILIAFGLLILLCLWWLLILLRKKKKKR